MSNNTAKSTQIVVEAHNSAMTKYERQVKKQLIKLLIDDGRGHHHAKYAERLKDFTLKIVPLDSSICQTAAISFDDGTIYLNEGFLTDPATFYQLNVIIRHELLHNLLMHICFFVCFQAIQSGRDTSSSVLKYVPPEILTQEMCDLAVEKTPHSIRDVPDKFITENLLLSVNLSLCGLSPLKFPKRLQTEEFIEKFTELHPWTRNFLPEKFAEEE